MELAINIDHSSRFGPTRTPGRKTPSRQSESRTSLKASLGEELADHAGCAYQLLPHGRSDIPELLRPLAGIHLGRENVAL
jgi:hypothetical protein